MWKIFLFSVLLVPAVSYGTFGMFGNDQCPYPQSPFPVNSGDYANANQQRVNGLQSYRASLNAKMIKLNSDMANAQAVIKAYFPSPWCDAMFAHMDNGFDCCSVQPTSAQVLRLGQQRMPAGNTLENYTPEVVNTPTADQPPPTDQGGTYTEPTAGQSCLQTGFAAGAQWNKYACKDGGNIDPQVCSNAAISKSPGDYQKCINIINIYHNQAIQKRDLAQQIQDLDQQINPARAGDYTDPASNGGNKSGNFLSGLGSFLGGVMNVAVPFIMNQYMSYNSQQQGSGNPLRAGPRQAVQVTGGGLGGVGSLGGLGGGRMMYGPGSVGTLGGPSPMMQAPPPFYGPNYGYGLGGGGQYGQTLPGFQTGGFGCSPGMLGGGMNILSMLMGGMNGGGLGGMLSSLLGGGMNGGLGLNASLGGNFGLLGGGAPFAAMQMGYGNNYPAVPRYAMGGFSPPYQPGGIYGGTPTFIPNFNGPSLPNFFTGQPTSALFTPTTVGCLGSTCGSTSTAAPTYMNAGLNSGANAFYYAQQMNNNQMIAQNQAMMLQRQSELQYQLYQLRLMNSQSAVPSGTSYQNGYVNGLFQPTFYSSGTMTF